MNRKRSSLDGFIPADTRRRPRDDISSGPARRAGSIDVSAKPRTINGPKPQIDADDDKYDNLLSKDIEKGLSEIGKQDKKSKKEQRQQKKFEKYNKKRAKKGKKELKFKQWRRRVWVKRFFICLMLVLITLTAIYGYRIATNVSKLTGGNIFDLIQKQRLQEDKNGRTNILIFGTSPEGWDGADLADSIMVLSYSQDKNDIHTVSLPRDLYVKHKCVNWLGTTAGKLNEGYGCGKADANSDDEKVVEAAGQNEMAKAAQEVLGLDIHYKVHANWRVLMEVVDSLGGIDVTIEAYDGSPEIYDVATNVRYKNGETVHLNGERALALSRARGSAGGYGFSGGNFDRERNQQKILKAIIDKAKSSGFDINKIMGIMDSLGNNISTSFEAKEIQALGELLKSYNSDKVKSIPLVDLEDGSSLMRTGNIGGASVVIPSAGTFVYDDIQEYVNEKINPSTNDSIKADSSEKAKIAILNGTLTDGLATKHKERLEKAGFTVVSVGNANNRNQTEPMVYDVTKKKPKNLKKLTEIYNTTAITSDLPDSVKDLGADIVVVVVK